MPRGVQVPLVGGELIWVRLGVWGSSKSIGRASVRGGKGVGWDAGVGGGPAPRRTPGTSQCLLPAPSSLADSTPTDRRDASSSREWARAMRE